jgi:hypothetical protein
MPVSKKRKKDGKPVHRKPVEAAGAAELPHDHPDAKPGVAPVPRAGKPTNPFVTQQQQSKRGAQRGR